MKNYINKLSNLHIAVALFFIVLLTHLDIILYSSGQYFSYHNYGDLNYYINLRVFTFGSLMSGIFPFWTTKILCGVPVFANSESAIFYPLNFIYFILPVSKAINFSFLIHFFILSFSSFLWINNKIKDKFISLVVAVVAAFLSSTYLHACAAHLSNINTCCWFPLLLYFYDKAFKEKTYRYIFPVSIILCLQIFAGHWQYVYYTALASLLYVLFFCRNRYALTVIFSSYTIALFLAAIQLVSSLDFYFDGARQLGEDKRGTSYFSRLVYLFTLLFPGHIISIGENGSFWEPTIYFGALNFLIVVLALTHAYNKNILKICGIVLFLYILTFKPFSDIADKIIPFFSWFRTPCKLLFFANVLILPILAYGIKYVLLKYQKISKIFIVSGLILSIFIIASFSDISDFLMKCFRYQKMEIFTGGILYGSVIFSGILIFLLSVLLYFKKNTISKIILILLLIIEPILIMRTFIHKYNYESTFNFGFYNRESFNEQTRFFYNINLDLITGIENCSASYPDAVKNYVLFMKHLRHKFNMNNLLGMLRCRYIVNGTAEHIYSIEKTGVKTLNRLNILYDYKIETDKEKIYDILSDEKFNIFDTVVLEREPQFNLHGKGQGTINPIYFDETSIIFECMTDKPAIILYTDNFTKDWQAYEIDNPKQKYEVICADYIYKAISIDKGYHRIKIEYKPVSFVIGKWISVISWLIFLISWIILYKKKSLKSRSDF